MIYISLLTFYARKGLFSLELLNINTTSFRGSLFALNTGTDSVLPILEILYVFDLSFLFKRNRK